MFIIWSRIARTDSQCTFAMIKTSARCVQVQLCKISVMESDIQSRDAKFFHSAALTKFMSLRRLQRHFDLA